MGHPPRRDLNVPCRWRPDRRTAHLPPFAPRPGRRRHSRPTVRLRGPTDGELPSMGADRGRDRFHARLQQVFIAKRCPAPAVVGQAASARCHSSCAYFSRCTRQASDSSPHSESAWKSQPRFDASPVDLGCDPTEPVLPAGTPERTARPTNRPRTTKAPLSRSFSYSGGGILTHFPDHGYRFVEVRDLPS
jgi:hypothetical protein